MRFCIILPNHRVAFAMTNPIPLTKIPLFAGLGRDETTYLTSLLKQRKCSALETLFWVGDAGHEMYIILSGRVEISIPDAEGRDICLAVLGPGEFFGEISLLDEGPRTATARSVLDTLVIVLDRNAFRNCISRFPSMALSVIQVLSRRQRNTVEKLRGIRNLNEIMAETLTPWQKLSNSIAAMAASQAFLMTHAIAFGAWIAINLLLPKKNAPDPFPFPFLCFWTSCEAIFLSLFILISQSMQGQKDRVRNDVEYQIALKLQLEMMHLHRKMDEQAVLLEDRPVRSAKESHRVETEEVVR